MKPWMVLLRVSRSASQPADCRQLTITGVAVEKLFPAKFTKIKSRQDALQTTFSVFLDIFYPPNFGCFEENGLFQHPQAISLIDITKCIDMTRLMKMPRLVLSPGM